MGDSDNPAELGWYRPRTRPVLPLGSVHVSRSLARAVRRLRYTITVDQNFAGCIDGCAARSTTWITPPIREAFLQLQATGFAHSVEAWHDDRLVGGVYGLAVGGAFFAESMFSRMTDASKICLVHLTARLRHGNFKLLDVQQATLLLMSFGAVVLSETDFLLQLRQVITSPADFHAMPGDLPPQRILQLSTQTS